jgi:SAM-dependent methyltransferase
MALPLTALQRLAPLMRGAKILSLGYPDIMASAAEVKALFGYTPTQFTKAHEWHKTKEPMPESLELFEAIDAKVTIVDFDADHGVETIADLNYPHDFGQFDLVIDPGTLEHCFNIGQAFMNAAGAVRPGGRIFHISPMSLLNHGFYNLCPTLYHDFYRQNGWDVRVLIVLPAFAPVCRATARFDTHSEYLMHVLVERMTDAPLKFPIQTKYLDKIKEREERKAKAA